MPLPEHQKISLLVGLGNPGEKYAGTRHNIGFQCLDLLRSRLPGSFTDSHEAAAMVWKGRFRGANLYGMKPLTFMNLSGEAVGKFARQNNIQPSEILAVYDDVDLPLGRIRVRKGGSSGGHRGVESLITELGGAGFARLRIGIGRPENREQIDFVLSEFNPGEMPLVEKVLDLAVNAVKTILSRGISTAMNDFNGRNLVPENEQNKMTTNKSETDMED